MSGAEDKREQRLKLLEDHIGRSLAESDKTGELRSAPSYGKPLASGDGFDSTPAELRMGYKILKDAGVVPHEVALMQEIAALRQIVDNLQGDEASRSSARERLVALQQQLAMRLERLRTTGSL